MVSRNAKCCYYLYETNKYVACEGVNENSTTVVNFKDEKGAKEWKHSYCNSIVRCRECPIHIGNDKRYEEEE